MYVEHLDCPPAAGQFHAVCFVLWLGCAAETVCVRYMDLHIPVWVQWVLGIFAYEGLKEFGVRSRVVL